MDEQDTLMYQDIKCVVEKHFADPFMESRLSWSIRTIDRFRAQVEALKVEVESQRIALIRSRKMMALLIDYAPASAAEKALAALRGEGE